MLVSAARAVSAAAFEVGWVTARAAMYPLGLLRDRGDDLDPQLYTLTGCPPARRGLLGVDVAAATTPIVLVHGIVDNRSVFTMLRRGLRRRGFGCIRLVLLPAAHQRRPVDRAAARRVRRRGLRRDRRRLRAHRRPQPRRPGRALLRPTARRRRPVHTLVTLGTPARGHPRRPIPPPPSDPPAPARQRPDRRARRACAGCTTRFVAVHSDIDQLIVPARSAMITHPDLDAVNVAARGSGTSRFRSAAGSCIKSALRWSSAVHSGDHAERRWRLAGEAT